MKSRFCCLINWNQTCFSMLNCWPTEIAEPAAYFFLRDFKLKFFEKASYSSRPRWDRTSWSKTSKAHQTAYSCKILCKNINRQYDFQIWWKSCSTPTYGPYVMVTSVWTYRCPWNLDSNLCHWNLIPLKSTWSKITSSSLSFEAKWFSMTWIFPSPASPVRIPKNPHRTGEYWIFLIGWSKIFSATECVLTEVVEIFRMSQIRTRWGPVASLL